MRKAAFEELLLMMKENDVLKASVLSGYSRSSFYYRSRPKQQPAAVISSSRNRRRRSTDSAALIEAIEKVALKYPSYGVRRITAMLRRSGIITSRKKVYRLMKLANLEERNVMFLRSLNVIAITKPFSIRREIGSRLVLRSVNLFEHDFYVTVCICGSFAKM
jgi:hypothetical protein